MMQNLDVIRCSWGSHTGYWRDRIKALSIEEFTVPCKQWESTFKQHPET